MGCGVALISSRENLGGSMNLKRFFAIVFAILVVLSLGSTRLAAQTATTGDVAGVVTDPSNSVVPDAKINLKDNTKGNSQESKSSKDGGFRFYLLNPGPYTLTVTASGFQIQSRQVQVAVGQVFTADVQLSLGASTQTVTVTESAPLIQTENGDTSTSLSQQQVSQVPNPGNDLSAIAQLAPGVVVNTQGGFGNVEAFGLPATSNLFTINGMDDNDPFLNLNNSGATNLLLGSNEIQEADVVTNGFSGAYGTFAGINVNYITKSGGNDFHGNAIYYWNGSALNATDWITKSFGDPKPFDNANQWAASIGGPIKKDKLFFFFNTEGLRVLIPVPSTIVIPTLAFEQATIANLTANGLTNSIPFYCQNLAGICPGVTATTPPNQGAGLFNLYNGVANIGNAQPINTAQDPGGCDGFDFPIAPDAVASSRLGGISRPGIGNRLKRNGIPTVASCTEAVNEDPINFAPEKQVAGRGDWNIGPNDRAYIRMQYDQGIQPTNTDPVSPVFNTQSNQPEYQGQLNETHVFNPTLTNQFLVAATWYSAIFKSGNQAAADAAFPGAFEVNDGALSGIGGILFAFPQGRNVTQFQLGDDVSKTIGNHTLRVGAKYHKNYVSDHDSGFFTNPLDLPLTLGDVFEGGNPEGANTVGTVFIQHFPLSQDLPVRLYEVAGYIQDEWRVKPGLTITPALRLEHASNPTCVTDCFGQFFPNSSFSTIVGENADGVFPAYNAEIQTGRRQALLGYQNLQWEPRIGFAWQPFSGASGMLKSDFVVRGGVGIFYDIFPGAISDNISQNPPLDNPFQIESTSIGGTCPGFVSPAQNPGSNLFDCATAANTAFNTAFATGGNSTTFAPSITVTTPKTEAPQFYKWNLGIQKGLGPHDSISVEYDGNHGIHIPIFNNSVNAFGFFTLPETVPAAQYGPVTQVVSGGVSNYNGGTASYKHIFSGWLGGGVLQINYTYSHALDNVSNGGFFGFTSSTCSTCTGSILNPQNPASLKQNYGDADYDVRQNFNANYVWELPIRKALGGRGWAPLVDGWQVSGSVFLRTALPFSVVDSGFTNLNNYEAVVLPNPTAALPTHTCAGEAFAGANAVNTGATCGVAAGFVGAAGNETGFGVQGLRNAFRGPDYKNANFSFSKTTKFPGWERGSLSLGLQMFNMFNHPNFNLPVNDVETGLFGTIQSLVNPPTSILGSFLGGDASPRLIQLKAEFKF
jgi:carboxypeptidase family protein